MQALKKGEKLSVEIAGKKVWVQILEIEGEESQSSTDLYDTMSREELLKALSSKRDKSLSGVIEKFDEPFESPIPYSDWGLDKK